MQSKETTDTQAQQNLARETSVEWKNLASAEAKKLFGQYRKRFGAAGEMNFFGQPFNSETILTLEHENYLAALDAESDFHRLYFAADDPSALAALCTRLPSLTILTDLITRDPDGSTAPPAPDAIQDALLRSGFRELAQYRRMSCAAPRRVKSKGPGERAQLADASGLYERLCGDFDPRLDHLPPPQKFEEFVRKGQVIVTRDGSMIRGYFIFEIIGSKSHMNYWAADSDLSPARKLGLIMQYYSEMTRRGIKSVYCWVNSKNLSVIGLHERFGLQFDGTRDLIFLRTENDED